ncbi:unnamed protein product, partial [Pocillopora meandrina]
CLFKQKRPKYVESFSSSKHLDFERCSKQKSPVKISNFTIKNDSVLMNARVQIEELKEVTFLREEIPSTLNISMLSNVTNNQLINLKAKLPATPGNVVKCETCGLRQKVSACSSQYHLRASLRHDDINTTVTFFNDTLLSALQLFKVDTKQSLSEDIVVEAFLNTPMLFVTFDKKTKVVAAVSVAEN